MPFTDLTNFFPTLPDDVSYPLNKTPAKPSAVCWFTRDSLLFPMPYADDEFENYCIRNGAGIALPSDSLSEEGVSLLVPETAVCSLQRWYAIVEKDDGTIYHCFESEFGEMLCVGKSQLEELPQRLLYLNLLQSGGIVTKIESSRLGHDTDFFFGATTPEAPQPWAMEFFYAENVKDLKAKVAGFLPVVNLSKRKWCICTEIHNHEALSTVLGKVGKEGKEGKEGDKYEDAALTVKMKCSDWVEVLPQAMAILFWLDE